MKNVFANVLIVLVAMTTLAACGNKGGSSTGPTADTTLVMSVSPTSIKLGEQATLTWFSRADSCGASGDWNGTKGASGTQVVGPFVTDGVRSFTLVCNNGAQSTSALLVGNASANDPNTKTSSDGKVTVTVVQLTPSVGPLTPGQGQFIKIHVVNRSDSQVLILIKEFGGGPTFEPHSETDSTQGSSHGSLSGSVPVIHVVGSYDLRNQVTAWTLDLPGWP